MLSYTCFTMIPPKDQRSHRGGLYQFQRPKSEEKYYCNGDEAEVRRWANTILDKMKEIQRNHRTKPAVWLAARLKELNECIEQYGDARVHDARGDWYEEAAGVDL